MKIGRLKKVITYHGRTGHPLLHKTPAGRLFIMVRKVGGGVKRLYEGSQYHPGKKSKTRRLKLK